MQLFGRPATIVQKVSSVSYATAVFASWVDRSIIVPLDPATASAMPGLEQAEIPALAAGGGWLRNRIDLDDDPLPAQVSFSSGTTGQPKPILISRRAISDTCRRLNAVMEVDPTIREYIGVPITYSFGLGRVRAVAAAGGQSFLPEKGFRLDEFARMLADGEVNALSAVPTLLRLVIQQRAVLAQCGEKLRWLEIGSQFMSAEEKNAVRLIFPNAIIVQHYGLTEASRTTFLRIDRASEAQLGSVGSATGQAEVRIDESGQICIRGPHLAEGVITAEGLARSADADGWLRTSDLGEIREGSLHFLGRADDLINVSGVKIPAGYFEQRLLEILGSDAVAVASSADALRGEAVLVAYTSDAIEDALREAVETVADEMGLFPSDIKLWRTDVLSRTDTGKVKRRALSEAYAAHLATNQDPAATGGPVERLRSFYQSLAPRSPLDSQASFASLQGDSLSYVQATILIEEVLGALPAHWETLSLGEIEKISPSQSPKRQGFKVVEGEMLARTFAIAAITASHAWFPNKLFGFGLAGGSSILLVIFGLNLFRFRSATLLSPHPFKIVPSIFLRYILPYYLVILIFSAKEGFHWYNFALLGVFHNGPSGALHMYWFFEALLHLTVIVAAIFALPPVRDAMRARPIFTLLGLLAAAIALRVLVEFARPSFAIPPRTPDAFLYLAIGGIALAAARKKSVEVAIAAILVTTVSWGAGFDSSWGPVLAIGLALVIFLPQVRLPAPIAFVVREIAQSTIYIYLGSRFVVALFVSGLHNRFPPLEFLATFAVGIAIGHAVRSIETAWQRRAAAHRLTG